MRSTVFDAAIEWMAATTQAEQVLKLTFHGGEPLLAGHNWYRRSLPALRRRFDGQVKMSIQSNLWLLDDQYCSLFREYHVSIGTSLDGPESINDAQRGVGYFARTMAGISIARRHGLPVGVICTFTRRSAPHYREVFDFFASQKLKFTVHAAMDAQGRNVTHDSTDPARKGLVLTPTEHTGLLRDLFDYYYVNITRTSISMFDSMARSIAGRHGGLCIFSDCLGAYLTIAPDGGIFPCNRFSCDPQWRLGWIQEQPSLDDLRRSPIWKLLQERELSVRDNCRECVHFVYCKGGCAYNALVGSDLDDGASLDRRDPHCEAYRRLFSRIGDRAVAELFSEQNLAAVVEHGSNRYGLFQRGGLLEIMRRGLRP